MNLITGEALEELKKMEDGCIDLTVTSPPYDNLRTYNGNNDQWGEHVWRGVIKQLYRVTKDGGVVVWVVGDATIKGSETGTSFKQALWAKECGFNLHDTMIYQKAGVTFPDKNRYYNGFEYMFVWSKGKPTFNPIKDRKNKWAGTKIHGTLRYPDGTTKEHIRKGREIPDYGTRFNIWEIASSGKAGTKHPATFPEQLAHDHIISWSNEGDIVLDPFMGSGTTGKVASLLNRDFIGIDIEEDYVKIAEARIRGRKKEATLL